MSDRYDRAHAAPGGPRHHRRKSRHVLRGGEVVVGRGPDAGIAVADERVLREHAVLQRHPGAWVLVDRFRRRALPRWLPGPDAPDRRARRGSPGRCTRRAAAQLRPATLDGGVVPPIPPRRRASASRRHAQPAEQPDRSRRRARTARPSRSAAARRTTSSSTTRSSRATTPSCARALPTASELVDLGEPNGTFLNGRRIADPAALDPLDVVAIGALTSFRAHRRPARAVEAYVGRSGSPPSRLGARDPHAGRPRSLDGDRLLARGAARSWPSSGPRARASRRCSARSPGFRPARRRRACYFGGRDLYADYDELRHAHRLRARRTTSSTAALTVRAGPGLRRRAALLARTSRPRASGVARVDEVIGRARARRAPRTSPVAEALRRPAQARLRRASSCSPSRRCCSSTSRPRVSTPAYERTPDGAPAPLADGGRTVVVVTHSTAERCSLCDRVLFLAPGGRTGLLRPAAARARALRRHRPAGRLPHAVLRRHPRLGARVPPSPTTTSATSNARARRRRHREPTRAREPIWSGLPSPLGWLKQFSTLSRRYAKVIRSDRRNLALLLAQPARPRPDDPAHDARRRARRAGGGTHPAAAARRARAPRRHALHDLARRVQRDPRGRQGARRSCSASARSGCSRRPTWRPRRSCCRC